MLVRGASATPEAPAVVNTTSASRKRKHTDSGTDDIDIVDPLGPPDIVLARDTSRPRLTVSRHPVFLPSTDGSLFQLTELCAVNRILDKVGFKYSPAGLAELGAAIPYRTIESSPMCTRVSWEDRSPLIRVAPDGLCLKGAKGFRSARANVGVQEGGWYMEVNIEKGGGDGANQAGRIEGSYVRLGWGRREAPLNGPVGLDGYSYGLRDKTGEKVTLSRPRAYGKPFGTGDVVGLYISLPPRRIPNPKDPDDPAHIHRERIAIDFKGQEYFESLDYPQSKEMVTLMEHPSKDAKAEPPQTKKSATVKNLPNDRGRNKPARPKVTPLRPLPILQDSKIVFFINGECQGIAFQDLYDYLQLHPPPGSRKNKDKQRRNREGPREHTENHFDDGTLGYYPFFSLFGDAQIRLNPGPDFAFPPPLDIDAMFSSELSTSQTRTWRPMSERYAEYMSQQWALDSKEEAEAKGEPENDVVIDEAEEEKIRLKRERKRKSEAARRKRLKEDKLAATAAASTASDSVVASDLAIVPVSTFPSSFAPENVVTSSPAPSLGPSIAPSATVDTDLDDNLVTSSTRVSTSKAHAETASVDILGDSSVPQTPQYSDLGVPIPEAWNSEDDDAIAEESEPKHENAQRYQAMSSPHLGFEESSTRWTNQ